MKPQLTFTIALILFASRVFSQANLTVADRISGIYWSPKKDAKIEVYKQGNKYYGKSIWIATPKKDDKNPNESLRNRNLLGIELLSDFNFDHGSYTNGKIYDPDSGKTYDCTMNLMGDDLKVRGYIGISLFGRTEMFERIK
ncbi:MAG: DUF2147 domain-containing protein [Saprospiraceae bacterium]|uniref:DUF2147 domain-containing protein n=1 Tax=Candidatus Opimibacter skivensis TaxID=2982028 RepID=A0A9D7XQ54_9BACT|nr:DUF2147 domain-containing protein [Candidatus Opimibacter skivensis]